MALHRKVDSNMFITSILIINYYKLFINLSTLRKQLIFSFIDLHFFN